MRRPSIASRFLLLAAVSLAMPARALDPQRHAWEYHVQSWSTRDGLPHNMIHDLEQDAAGFLWIATWEGVVRFDGRDFKVFDNGNVPGLDTRAFRALARDPQGRLLAGSSRQGVWRREGNRWIAPQGEAAHLWVTALLPAPDGSVWVGSERGPNLQAADGRLLRNAHATQTGPNLWVQGMVFDADGSVVMAADAGLYEGVAAGSLPRQVTAERGLPPGNVRAVLRRRDGSVWVAPQTGVYRREQGRYAAVPQFEGKRIDALLEDRHGVLWANSSADGLLRLAGAELEAIGPAMGVHGRGTSALLEDREGLLWFGTTDGLYRVSDGAATTVGKLQGLSDDYVRTVLPDGEGGMWIGTSAGLDLWRDGQVRRIDAPWRGRTSSSVLSLARTPQGVWLGTYDQGLILLPGDGGQPQQVGTGDGLPSQQVRALLPARDGGLWIGTVLGLAHRARDGAITRIGGDSMLGTGVVRALMEQPDGALWTGASSGIVVWRPPGRLAQYDRDSRPAFPADIAFDFLADPDGTIWIGSDSGIVRMRGGEFHRYGTAAGLPNESIFRILPGAGKDLWFTSNRGVFRIPRTQFDEIDAGTRSRLAVEVVDRSSGMGSDQANGNSAPAGAVGSDGRLWIPTSGGVAIIHPRANHPGNGQRIPVVIESVLLDGIEQSRTDVLEVPAHVRRVVVRYAGLDFRNAGNLRYRYRMEGFDRDWIEATDGNEAVYTNLPPGPLRFRVQAMVRPADWSRAPRIDEAAVGLDVRPPWHRTWWAALLALAAASGAITLLWRMRNAVQLRRQRQLQAQVEQRTHELSLTNEALLDAARERQQLLDQLAGQVRLDELTGLPNRRALNEALAEACDSRRPCQLALVDADHFKQINDTHGHETGDEVLKHLAHTMQRRLGDHGMCARWGGEEFALMLPDMSPAAARALCEDMRAHVAATPYAFADGRQLPCTVSIGLSACHRGAPPQRLLHEADEQAYRAKAEGRNRVCAVEDA